MSLRKPLNRRVFLQSLASTSFLLPGMLHEMMAETIKPASNPTLANPLAPHAPMFPAKAKRVIFLYMSGGVSHVDTFDPKPLLTRDTGKLHNGDFLHASPWAFKRYAKCDTEVSELFPHVGAMMDDICVIRSMKNDIPNHSQAVLQIHGGSTVEPRPSIGSWASYALGTENQELPSYMVLAPEIPYGGAQCWDSGFLPACHQGIRVVPGQEAIPNISRANRLDIQEMDLGLINFFNQRNLAEHDGDKTLASRIKTFETAAGMQQEAPDAFDITKESDATLKMYGITRDTKKGFGWQCLVARRLAERGVRFVELIDTGSDKYNNWDSHLDIKMHATQARKVDKAIAGMLQDLKSRGMLDDTLVVWTTEFGRKPGDASPDEQGRTHWSKSYSSWVAGGGFKGGMTYGTTDDYGYEVVDKPVDIHDFHATLLNQMGLDHKKLTFRHAGRDYRLTDVSGNVVHDIIT
ncbi:DUF1501 domain-containing protein [Granulicella cerasi]|uniref:DUF1501 domain-containing protein n=1 Tax=Granulicella cerasi TaxID=741063 RepID=A0ABW1ZCA4_9BACT|nr:DUF1501 domain-containing protein [Granulicella cerasi]